MIKCIGQSIPFAFLLYKRNIKIIAVKVDNMTVVFRHIEKTLYDLLLFLIIFCKPLSQPKGNTVKKGTANEIDRGSLCRKTCRFNVKKQDILKRRNLFHRIGNI